MITSHQRPNFAVSFFDEATNRFTPRPHADVVRYVAPAMPAPGHAATNDEWQPYVRAQNPVDLTGAVLWLHPDDLTGSEGNGISDWPARIGPTPTATTGPLYRGGGGPFGNHNAIEFTGSQWLEIPQNELQARPWTRYTIVAVAQLASNTSERTLITNDKLGYEGDFLMGCNLNTEFSNRMGVRQHSVGTTYLAEHLFTDTNTDTAWHYWGTRYNRDAPGWYWYEDDFTTAEDSDETAFAANQYIGRNTRAWQIGRNAANTTPDRYWSGKLCELIIFDRCLTAVEMAALGKYLDAEHGS